MLTHTSGLPRDSKLTNFRELFQPTREDALNALPSQKMKSIPGQKYTYSNLGFALLGELISTLSGQSYESYIKNEILRPLGMKNSLVHPNFKSYTAWGHGPIKKEGKRDKAGFWNLRFATPAGGMATSVEELSYFVADQLIPYSSHSEANTILTENTIKDMHRVQYELNPDRGGSGLAWGVETSENRHLVYHGGELPEQTSYVLIDIKNQIGIIVLTNAQSVNVGKLSEDILLGLLN